MKEVVGGMREITVTYLLSEEQEERLRIITEAFNKKATQCYKEHSTQKFSDKSEDAWFKNIMCEGSKFDINDRFTHYEKMFGISGKTGLEQDNKQEEGLNKVREQAVNNRIHRRR